MHREDADALIWVENILKKHIFEVENMFILLETS